LAGGRGWNQKEIAEAIKKSSKKQNIIFTGYIDGKHKPAIYSGAEAFLYPSHYEGFGLPLLEAMACGVPVITADNSSLREVADKAALYVNSKSTKELLTAIIKIVMNKSIRQDLINKGNKRVKEFNWKDSANEMNKSILKALNE
jgi:glycosyltransferase involved in cell wall biosynthesis